jgi:hypothetical protein
LVKIFYEHWLKKKKNQKQKTKKPEIPEIKPRTCVKLNPEGGQMTERK